MIATERDAGTDAAVPGATRHLSLGIPRLYLALYLHFGFYAFLPLWLAKSGVAAGEIGLLMAIPLVLRLVTVAPISAWAGRHGRVRDAIAVSALLSAGLIAMLLAQPGYLARIVIVALFSIAWDQVPVLVDAYAVMAVRARGLDFGRLRVWGSIGAVASSACAGWIFDAIGITALPLVVALLLILPVVAARLLPSDRRNAEEADTATATWHDVVADRTLVRLIVAAALVMASHGVLTSFGAIQWNGGGMSTGTIGVLQATAIGAEILAFWFGGRLLGDRDPALMIWIAALVAVLRWILMAAAPPFALLFAVQLLQGITATGAILGAMLVIAKRMALPASAAAQGFNAVVLGLTLSAATAGSGVLWSRGASFAYLTMAALATLAAMIAWPRSSRRGDATAFTATSGGPADGGKEINRCSRNCAT